MATYTKSASSRAKELQKELEFELIKDIKDHLTTKFILLNEEKGEELGKIEILQQKDNIINEITQDIYDTKENNNKFRYKYADDYTRLEIAEKVDNLYLKHYNEFYRQNKLMKRAKKDYIKTLLYQEIEQDIKDSKYNIIDTIKAIKGSNYKELLIKEIIEKYNFDINDINDVYSTTLNKVVRVYKQDTENYEELLELEEEKKKLLEQQRNMQVKKAKNKIPLGWKAYGISKIFNSLWK